MGLLLCLFFSFWVSWGKVKVWEERKHRAMSIVMPTGKSLRLSFGREKPHRIQGEYAVLHCENGSREETLTVEDPLCSAVALPDISHHTISRMPSKNQNSSLEALVLAHVSKGSSKQKCLRCGRCECFTAALATGRRDLAALFSAGSSPGCQDPPYGC